MKPIGLNTQVRYSRKFLKSIHAGPTDDLWRAKGTVTALRTFGGNIPALATVEGFPLREDGTNAVVLVSNLSRVDVLEIDI